MHKVQPQFADCVRAIFTGSFQRIHGHAQHKLLYAIVQAPDRKVRSVLQNIYVTLDSDAKCWVVCNSLGRLLHSVGPLHTHVQNQTRFAVPNNKNTFVLAFRSCKPWPQTDLDTAVPPSIQVSFLIENNQAFRCGGVFALGGVQDPGQAQDPATPVSFKQYDRTTASPGQCCLVMQVGNHLGPFGVTSAAGASHFVACVRWVFCDHEGREYARSLDLATSPLAVLWWEMYDAGALVYSGMDLCISTPCPVMPHDVEFVGSDNLSLNCLFTFKVPTPENALQGMTHNTYERTHSTQTSTALLQLVFLASMQKWLVMSLDVRATPQMWNQIAISNSSGTYTNPALCKEWSVLDSSGIYKLSPGMTCVIRARRVRLFQRPDPAPV